MDSSLVNSFQNLICISTLEPIAPQVGVLRPPIKTLNFDSKKSISASSEPSEVAEARELPANVARPVKELSNEVNTETGSLSIVENVSQGASPRVPVSGDLKIPDGLDLRTSESDRAAKIIEDELTLPDLPTDLASDAEIVLSLVEEPSSESASKSTSLS